MAVRGTRTYDRSVRALPKYVLNLGFWTIQRLAPLQHRPANGKYPVSRVSKFDDEREIATQIETYRQGFLQLNPERIASIWDTDHVPLIYVAQEMRQPTYGWDAIHRYFAALPDHLEKVLSKALSDVRIDVLGDAAIAFFISHTVAKLKRQAGLHEPTFRATMIFHRTAAGWRVIHYHESSLAALAAQVTSSTS